MKWENKKHLALKICLSSGKFWDGHPWGQYPGICPKIATFEPNKWEGSKASVVMMCVSLWSAFVTEILWPKMMAFSVLCYFLSILEPKQMAETIHVELWLTYWSFLKGKNEGDFSFSFLFSIRVPFLSSVFTSQST